MTTHTLHVSGTHCASCKITIEDILKEQPGVSRVDVNLHKQTVTIEGEIADNPEMLSVEFSALLAPHHYRLTAERGLAVAGHSTTLLAIAIGLVVLALFFLLQRSGVLNLGFERGLTPLTALMIGVVASLSTCLAIVGGLVLSLSALISKDVSTIRPFLFFHGGRLVGFALLGGALGVVGERLSLSAGVATGLGITASFVMIILGINLLDVLHLTRRFQFVLPRGIFDRLTSIENGFFAPLLIGLGTFFLPCGFTQAMQIAALGSGSFLGGLSIMGMFALGTLPVLALLSFGSFSFAQSRYAPLFFRTAGVIVIGFGLLSLAALLASLGIIRPLFNI